MVDHPTYCVEHLYRIGTERLPEGKVVVVTCEACPYRFVVGRARSNGRLARMLRKIFIVRE